MAQEPNTELVLHQQPTANQPSIYNSPETFENAQRISKMLASSNIVPEQYQNNIANTMVALEMANRMQVSPLMVMQNLDIIHGKPAFNSKFTAAMVNGCGKYESLRYTYTGEGDKRQCVAHTKDLRTGEVLTGPPVSIAMAKAEGWWTKKGSKWPTMPDLMLSYRAATFWCRLYEPGLTMGLPTSDELYDIAPVQTATVVNTTFAAVNEKVRSGTQSGNPPNPEQKEPDNEELV